MSENPNLVTAIAPEVLNHIIPEGAYQGQSVASTLGSTPEGQILLRRIQAQTARVTEHQVSHFFWPKNHKRKDRTDEDLDQSPSCKK